MSASEHRDQILAVFTEEAQKRILKELTLCAEYHLRLYFGSGEGGRQGRTGEDIAHEAIEKVFTGQWAWDPERAPLIPYMKTQVIPGLIANLVTSKEAELSSRIELDGAAIPAVSPTPVQEMYAEEVLTRTKAHIAGDRRIEQVFEARGQELTRAEACEKYGMTTKEYDNATKRLDRKIHELISEKELKVSSR
jgi:hypothetical protein